VFHLLGLVEEKILQGQEIVQWRKALGDAPPREGSQETIVFKDFILRGFGIPTSDFFRGLLFHWGIQAHHLTPNSILHISMFVHLCEAYLGIEPHFDLFQHLFHLKLQPSTTTIDVVGGAGVQLHQGLVVKYIPYKLSSNVIDWKDFWFYIENQAPALPTRTQDHQFQSPVGTRRERTLPKSMIFWARLSI
jgi:hypothetical protein